MADTPNEGYHLTETPSEEKEYYARLAAESTRACRIRSKAIPLVGLLSSLLLCLLTSAWHGAFAGVLPPAACLFFGALLSLFAIPCHLLSGSRSVIGTKWVKSLFYVVGILFNTAGTALCMAAYYIHLDAAPSTSEATAVLLAILLLYGLTALFIHLFPDNYGAVTASASLLTVAAGAVAVVFWVRNEEKTLWSLGFFLLLQSLITLISLHVSCSDEDSPWLRFSSLAAFGVLMIVAAVVLLILICASGDCDCDCGDCGCGDCCDCGGGERKIKRKPKK